MGLQKNVECDKGLVFLLCLSFIVYLNLDYLPVKVTAVVMKSIYMNKSGLSNISKERR
jgi:hypothetical protein